MGAYVDITNVPFVSMDPDTIGVSTEIKVTNTTVDMDLPLWVRSCNNINGSVVMVMQQINVSPNGTGQYTLARSASLTWKTFELNDLMTGVYKINTGCDKVPYWGCGNSWPWTFGINFQEIRVCPYGLATTTTVLNCAGVQFPTTLPSPGFTLPFYKYNSTVEPIVQQMMSLSTHPLVRFKINGGVPSLSVDVKDPTLLDWQFLLKDDSVEIEKQVWAYNPDFAEPNIPIQPLLDPAGVGAYPYNATHSLGNSNVGATLADALICAQIANDWFGADPKIKMIITQQTYTAVFNYGNNSYSSNGFMDFIGDVANLCCGIATEDMIKDQTDAINENLKRTAELADTVAVLADSYQAFVSEVENDITGIRTELEYLNKEVQYTKSSLELRIQREAYISYVNIASLSSYVQALAKSVESINRFLSYTARTIQEATMVKEGRIELDDPMLWKVYKSLSGQSSSWPGYGLGVSANASNPLELIQGSWKKIVQLPNGKTFVVYAVPLCSKDVSEGYTPVNVYTSSSLTKVYSNSGIVTSSGFMDVNGFKGSCLLPYNASGISLNTMSIILPSKDGQEPGDLLSSISGPSSGDFIQSTKLELGYCIETLMKGRLSENPVMVKDKLGDVYLMIGPYTPYEISQITSLSTTISVVKVAPCIYYVEYTNLTVVYSIPGLPVPQHTSGRQLLTLSYGDLGTVTGTKEGNLVFQTGLGCLDVDRTDAILKGEALSGVLTALTDMATVSYPPVPNLFKPEVQYREDIWNTFTQVAANYSQYIQDAQAVAESAREIAAEARQNILDNLNQQECSLTNWSGCTPSQIFANVLIWAMIVCVCALGVWFLWKLYQQKGKNHGGKGKYAMLASGLPGATAQIFTTSTSTKTTSMTTTITVSSTAAHQTLNVSTKSMNASILLFTNESTSSMTWIWVALAVTFVLLVGIITWRFIRLMSKKQQRRNSVHNRPIPVEMTPNEILKTDPIYETPKAQTWAVPEPHYDFATTATVATLAGLLLMSPASAFEVASSASTTTAATLYSGNSTTTKIPTSHASNSTTTTTFPFVRPTIQPGFQEQCTFTPALGYQYSTPNSLGGKLSCCLIPSCICTPIQYHQCCEKTESASNGIVLGVFLVCVSYFAVRIWFLLKSAARGVENVNKNIILEKIKASASQEYEIKEVNLSCGSCNTRFPGTWNPIKLIDIGYKTLNGFYQEQHSVQALLTCPRPNCGNYQKPLTEMKLPFMFESYAVTPTFDKALTATTPSGDTFEFSESEPKLYTRGFADHVGIKPQESTKESKAKKNGRILSNSAATIATSLVVADQIVPSQALHTYDGCGMDDMSDKCCPAEMVDGFRFHWVTFIMVLIILLDQIIKNRRWFAKAFTVLKSKVFSILLLLMGSKVAKVHAIDIEDYLQVKGDRRECNIFNWKDCTPTECAALFFIGLGGCAFVIGIFTPLIYFCWKRRQDKKKLQKKKIDEEAERKSVEQVTMQMMDKMVESFRQHYKSTGVT